MLANLASNIETEKKNLYKMARKIDHKLDKMEGIRMNINDGKSILISQEEIKNDGFSDDFGLQTEKDSKVSLKSGEILFSEPPINFNYNELPLKKLRPIKEEDYSYQNRDEETLQVKKASPDNLEPLAESQKLKDLQSALSRSLNKKKVEDFYTSKIEHTVFQSFEHSQRNEEGDDQNIYNNTLLTEMRKNNINGNSFSSSESSHSQIEEPIGSPFRVLKNCDPVKKVF